MPIEQPPGGDVEHALAARSIPSGRHIHLLFVSFVFYTYSDTTR